MDPVTRLVLVRHGESRATVDRMMGGHDGCQGLTERGRRQACALVDRLARTGELADASMLFTSALARAVETAEIRTPALGKLEVVQDCTARFHPPAPPPVPATSARSRRTRRRAPAGRTR